MGIRNPHAEMLSDHELVLPAGVRPAKADLAKVAASSHFLNGQRNAVNSRDRMAHLEPQDDPFLEDFL